jgi:hypothetical protein
MRTAGLAGPCADGYASTKEPAVFWVIRWTDQHSGEDKSIVVEAESQAEAEYMGLKRGIPIVFLGEASDSDIADASRNKMLWKYSRVSPYSCFGRSLTTRQVVFFMTAGIATALVNLRPVIEHLRSQMY